MAGRYCARGLLSQHADFQAQKGLLEELEATNQIVLGFTTSQTSLSDFSVKRSGTHEITANSTFFASSVVPLGSESDFLNIINYVI
jgi:hypothetical protein